MSLKSAYYAGKRAGLAAPAVERINGLAYLKYPQAPFTLWQPLSLLLWNEGYYTGIVERLDAKKRY